MGGVFIRPCLVVTQREAAALVERHNNLTRTSIEVAQRADAAEAEVIRVKATVEGASPLHSPAIVTFVPVFSLPKRPWRFSKSWFKNGVQFRPTSFLNAVCIMYVHPTDLY